MWVWSPSKLKANDLRRCDNNLVFGPSGGIFIEMVRDARNEIVVEGISSHFDADDHPSLSVVRYPRSARDAVGECESYLAIGKCEEAPLAW